VGTIIYPQNSQTSIIGIVMMAAAEFPNQRRRPMPDEIAVLRAALRANPEHHKRLLELAEDGAFGPMVDVPDDVPLTVVAGPEHFGIDNSQEARCECGAVVWLSPSTQRMIIARGGLPKPIRILCGWCFMHEMRNGGADDQNTTH
jgi:hypothetical protein